MASVSVQPKGAVPAFPFAALSTTSGVGSLNRLLWKGYLYDKDLGCYCLGKRHYDPFALRFWEPDGLSFLDPSTPGGINQYIYCLNDPITYTDQTGRLPILIAALIGMAVGVILTGGFEMGAQLVKNDFNWNQLDWAAIGRQAIIGGALGFAGGAGGAALGGFLAGSASFTGAKAFAWFGISSLITFGGGVGAYAAETFGHGSKWDWGEAAGSGLLGMAAGMFAYGAGGVSKLLISPSNWITRFAIQKGVYFIFSWPLNFAEGQLIDYLS